MKTQGFTAVVLELEVRAVSITDARPNRKMSTAKRRDAADRHGNSVDAGRDPVGDRAMKADAT
jgi:hypothetical protein